MIELVVASLDTAHTKSSQTDNPTKQLQQLASGRVDVDPVIEAMKNGTFQSSFSDEQLEHPRLTSKEAEKLWNEMKVERNSLLAIFIEEIWKSFAEDRSEMLSLTDDEKIHTIKESPEKTIDALSFITKRMFYEKLLSWRERRNKRLSQPLEMWDRSDFLYSKYIKMVSFGVKTGSIAKKKEEFGKTDEVTLIS